MNGPAGPPGQPPRSSLPVIGVAVRDPNIREVLLALIRLNRMPVRGLGTMASHVEVGPPDPADALLVGYIASDEDAEYFDEALRQTGNLPSVALVPRGTSPRLVERVASKAAKIVSLPVGAQTIADAIRAQLEAKTASGTLPVIPARAGSSDVV